LPILFENMGNEGAGESAKVVQVQPPAISDTAGKYLWDDPKYQLGGAAPLFIIFPVVGRGGIVDLGEDLINLLIFVVLGGVIVLVHGRKAFNLPATVWYTLLATLILFVMAWLAIGFTGSAGLLYFPSRYTRVGLFLFSLMFVCLNLEGFLKEAPLMLRNKPRQLIWLIAGIEIFIVVLVVGYPSEWATVRGFNMKWLLIVAGALCGILGFLIYRMPQRSAPNRVTSKTRPSFAFRIMITASGLIFLLGWAVYAPIFTEVSYLNPPPSQRALFQFLQTLPKDTLIAGTPCALDSVPLFARRTALFSCEFEKSSSVIPEALSAYYTDDPEVIIDFCRTYQIDYLVVDSEAYTSEYVQRGQMFFKPYNHQLLTRIGDRDQFVLAEVPNEEKLFQAENYFVVRCDSLGELK